MLNSINSNSALPTFKSFTVRGKLFQLQNAKEFVVNETSNRDCYLGNIEFCNKVPESQFYKFKVDFNSTPNGENMRLTADERLKNLRDEANFA